MSSYLHESSGSFRGPLTLTNGSHIVCFTSKKTYTTCYPYFISQTLWRDGLGELGHPKEPLPYLGIPTRPHLTWWRTTGERPSQPQSPFCLGKGLVNRWNKLNLSSETDRNLYDPGTLQSTHFHNYEIHPPVSPDILYGTTERGLLFPGETYLRHTRGVSGQQ